MISSILVSNTIKNESELTNSRNKINESDTYHDRNIYDKEKTNKYRWKTISKNRMNQSHYYNIDNDNNLNIHKEETSIPNEDIVNKDNDTYLSLDPTSKEERLIQSRIIDETNPYKQVIQRREEGTKQNEEHEIVAIGSHGVVNKEGYNNKVSHDIKQSEYKETVSVTHKTNGSNNKYNEFGSEPIFKEENYITSSKGGEYNKFNTVSQREKEEPKQKAKKNIANGRGSKMANKEATNNKNSKSKES